MAYALNTIGLRMRPEVAEGIDDAERSGGLPLCHPTAVRLMAASGLNPGEVVHLLQKLAAWRRHAIRCATERFAEWEEGDVAGVLRLSPHLFIPEGRARHMLYFFDPARPLEVPPRCYALERGAFREVPVRPASTWVVRADGYEYNLLGRFV